MTYFVLEVEQNFFYGFVLKVEQNFNLNFLSW